MHRILEQAFSFIQRFSNPGGEGGSVAAPVVRLSVMASGKILLDGKPATIDEVKRALERTKARGGTVWYYRESGEPARAAVELFKFMVEIRLPISLSSKADFSDYVDDEGRSHRRKA